MRFLVLLSVVLCAVTATFADPVVVDLTYLEGMGTVNGAVFDVWEAKGTGSGNFQALVRMKNNYPAVSGHNTSYSEATYFDLNSIRRNVRVVDLPMVGLNGKAYFEFYLDINEPKGGNSEFLSLEQVKIYTGSSAGAYLSPQALPPAGTWYPTEATLRYDLDAGDVGNVVLMNAGVTGGGQGALDVRVLVPVETILAPGVSPYDYVYLWSVMGSETQYQGHDGWTQDATFEEWSTNSDISTLPSGGDWGDLPDPSFPTLYSTEPGTQSGAVHLTGLFEWLGPGAWIVPTDPRDPWVNPSWDSEEDGQPSVYADGDDNNPVVDGDEDGVGYFAGADDTIAVTLTVAEATRLTRYDDQHLLYLDGWWDKNGDGQFDEATEHVVAKTYDPSDWDAPPPDSTINTYVDLITIPGFAPSMQAPYWRWRLNYLNPNLYWGESTYGEVEDYYATPEPVSLMLLGLPALLLARRRHRK